MKNVCSMLFAVFVTMICCTPAGAQQMYRCGNQFQDRPCDGGQQGKAIGSAKSVQSRTKLELDSQCERVGASVQKIIWAREAGRTAEMQLVGTTNSEERRLISEVFRRQGPYNEIRTAIEGDCMAEKERAAQAAALIQAAGELQGQGRGGSASNQIQTGGGAQPASDASDEKRVGQKNEKLATTETEGKKARCNKLNSKIENIRSQQRAGGNVANMESLNRDRQDMDSALRNEGC